MSQKIIFFDVDGTIIAEDGYIPPSTITAIRAAQRAGNLCFVNTGRPYSHVPSKVKSIGFSGYICSCGQHVLYQDELCYHTGFTPKQSYDILQYIRSCRLEVVFESESGVWHWGSSVRVQKNKKHFKALGFPIDRSVDEPDFCFDKFCIWPTDQGDLKTFLINVAPYCEVIFRENNFMELTCKGCSKQKGIEYILDRIGIPRNASYAIGDSTNDLPMLQCVAHGIVMGNASEEVKKAAEFVTLPLCENGIDFALRHYGLCGL